MKVGDIVISKDRGVTSNVLHSGANFYTCAIVACLNPFILISEEGDMVWTHIDSNDIQVLCQASDEIVVACLEKFRQKVNAGLLAGVSVHGRGIDIPFQEVIKNPFIVVNEFGRMVKVEPALTTPSWNVSSAQNGEWIGDDNICRETAVDWALKSDGQIFILANVKKV